MEPTEAIVNLLAKSMRDVANKSASADHWIPDARNALRAILASPQDYGLGVPPTRSQLEEMDKENTGGDWNETLNNLIARGWATDDPIPEPEKFLTDRLNELTLECGKAYPKQEIIQGLEHEIMMLFRAKQ